MVKPIPTHLFLLVMTSMSVKRKRQRLWRLTLLPKVSLATVTEPWPPSRAPSRHEMRVTFSRRLTSQREAEMSGTARRTSLKSNCCDRISSSSIRSIERAVSLHSFTNC